MEKTLLTLIKDLWKAPAGKQVIGLCFFIAFSVPVFLGYYYADVMAENKALKIELKEKDIKIQEVTNNYIRVVEQCATEKANIVELLNGKLSEYKEQVTERDRLKALEIEAELRQLRRGVKQTDIILQKTIQIQKN